MNIALYVVCAAFPLLVDLILEINTLDGMLFRMKQNAI